MRCVGGVLHDRDGRLLLIQRRHEPAAGRWTLPGGKVEPGESDAIALAREVREETGLDVRPGELLGIVVIGEFDIHDYRCALLGGELVAGDDAADARWVTAAEFADLDRRGALTDDLTAILGGWRVLPR